MGAKVNLTEQMQFPTGPAALYAPQLPADTYAQGTHETEAVDVSLFHKFGVVFTCDAPNLTGAVSLSVECNDVSTAADAGWTSVGITGETTIAAGVLANLTGGGAETAAANLFWDGVKTSTLPVSGNALPSVFVRLSLVVADVGGEVAGAAIFVTEANYSTEVANGGGIPVAE